MDTPYSSKIVIKQVHLSELWIFQLVDAVKLYNSLLNVGFLLASVSSEFIFYGLGMKNGPIAILLCEVFYGDKKSSPEFRDYVNNPAQFEGSPLKFLIFLMPKLE